MIRTGARQVSPSQAGLSFVTVSGDDQRFCGQECPRPVNSIVMAGRQTAENIRYNIA